MQIGTLQRSLSDGAVYVGDNGRLLCADPACAGAAAVGSGRDASGHPLARVTVDTVREWPTVDAGPLRCDCRRVTLLPVAGADGWPRPVGRLR